MKASLLFQTCITGHNGRRTLEVASKMTWHQFIVYDPLPVEVMMRCAVGLRKRTPGWHVIVRSRALLSWITGILSGGAPTCCEFILLESASLFYLEIYIGV